MNNNFFDTKVEFLKGIGPIKATVLNKEINVFTYADLIQRYPFRHEDRTQFHQISDIVADMPYIQLKGKIKFIETVGEGSKERFIAYLRDSTGDIELVWFKGVNYIKKFIQLNQEYIIYGKPSEFNNKINISHPEIELYNPQEAKEQGALFPVYNTTETMKKKMLVS
jgi:ATP-dependent DNA helicase RecG